MGFPSSSTACNTGDPSLIPGLGRSAGEGIGYPLQYSWASLVAQLVKNPPAMPETWVGKIPWRKERVPTPVFWSREFHGLDSPWACKESDRLSDSHFQSKRRLEVCRALSCPGQGLGVRGTDSLFWEPNPNHCLLTKLAAASTTT